jgi:hypothetical protein
MVNAITLLRGNLNLSDIVMEIEWKVGRKKTTELNKLFHSHYPVSQLRFQDLQLSVTRKKSCQDFHVSGNVSSLSEPRSKIQIWITDDHTVVIASLIPDKWKTECMC